MLDARDAAGMEDAKTNDVVSATVMRERAQQASMIRSDQRQCKNRPHFRILDYFHDQVWVS